jgi:plastocyanin
MRLKNLVSTLCLSALIGVGCGGSNTTGAGGSGGSVGGTSGGAGATGGAFMAIAPCSTVSSYLAGMTAIATTADFKYSPACVKVTPGSMVTIDASAIHPLVGLSTGSANNPIPVGPSTTQQAVTFTTPGFYPFHCNVHFSIGMAGVVWVQ